MTTTAFDRWVKTFCIGATLYMYIFILSDILHLNPNDDRDISGLGKIFGFFPTLVVVVSILLDGANERLRRLKLILVRLSLLFMGGSSLVLFLIQLEDDLFQATSILIIPILLGLILAIPLGVYLICKKIETDRVSVGLIILGICIIGLSVYPAKNYVRSALFGDRCATLSLVVRQYASVPASWHQRVRGDVVCIAIDRNRPSETHAWRILENADAKTFEYLGDGYSRDKNTVFYEGLPITADPNTFQMDTNWQTEEMANFVRGGTPYKSDGHDIYFKGRRVPVADMKRFRIIDFCHSSLCATDGFSVFQEGKRVEGVNIKALTSFHSCEYTRDDKQVYFSGKIIDKADVHTFDIYDEDRYCYAYDRTHVYYQGTIVSRANPNTLRKVIPGDPFSPETDGENIYYNGERLDLDISTFQYLGKSVSKDAFTVYQGAEKVSGADAATFEIIPTSIPQVLNVCARDKYHHYFDGAIDDHPICTQ